MINKPTKAVLFLISFFQMLILLCSVSFKSFLLKYYRNCNVQAKIFNWNKPYKIQQKIILLNYSKYS